MNVAFINSTRKWGGVKTHTLEFGAALVERGHKVLIYARQQTFLDAAGSRCMQPVETKFGSNFSPFSIAYFLKEFKRNKIDIVIANVGKDMATAGIAARLLGIPLVQHLGAGKDIAPKAKYKILYKFLNPFFFCTAKFIAEEFAHYLPWAAKDRIRIVLNGKKVTTHPLTTNSPRRLVANHQLVAIKDYETMLKALAKVSSPFIFDVVGTGPLEQDLKQLASELGIQDKVVWHGFLQNPMEILNNADIFLLASLSEGLPNTLLEALSAGLLPICRDVGGVREVWPENFEQWLLPYDSSEADFARVIGNALELSDKEIIALKHQARETCKQKCDFEIMATEFEQCLLEISSKKSPA